MGINICEIDTSNRRLVKEFLALPYKIYTNIPEWVPPLASDAKLILNRHKHPYYRHSDATFFLAVDSIGDTVGGLAVQDPQRYNDYNQTKLSFFCLFECTNDNEVARRLFEAAIAWARSKKPNQIVGPKGFTVFDGYGVLVKGFEHRPAFGLPYNPPYYSEIIEYCGFSPELEIASGYLDSNFDLPEKIVNLSQIIINRRGLSVRNFRSRRELRAMIPKL